MTPRGVGWALSAPLTSLCSSGPDQVNPPGNVTAEVDGTRLSVRWEKPVSAFPSHCWDYEVKVYSARKGYVQVTLQSAPTRDGSAVSGNFQKLWAVTALRTAWN